MYLKRHNSINLSCIRSKVAYENKVRITSFYNTPMLHKNKTFETNVNNFKNDLLEDPLFYGDMCHVVWDKNNLYVNYTGTRDVIDMIKNIDIRHKKLFKDIKVHQGFHDKFFKIESELTKDIIYLVKEYPIKNIYFTGHSSGGAISLISGPYYGHMLQKQRIIVDTFASTCVGNIHFLNWFSNHVDVNSRIESEGDIVPYIPIHDAFYHVPHGVFLKKNGDIELQYNISSLNYLTVLSMLSDKQKREEINTDHSCDTYLELLTRLYN